MEIATRRRLMDELNIHAEVEFVYKFSYQASFGKTGSENELCSVYLGRSNDRVAVNQTEISETRYLDPGELQREFGLMPDQFTPWFKMEWLRLNEDFAETLSRYTSVKTRQPT